MKSKKSVVLVIGLVFALVCSFSSLQAEEPQKIPTDFKGLNINIIPGEHYIHKITILPLIKVKAAPQIAIWIEDLNGKFIQTLFVTSKIAEQNWSKAPLDFTAKDKIKRKEALPYWSYKKALSDDKVDQVSSATPKKGSTISFLLEELGLEKFVIVAEINNSTDFNEYYSKRAEPGTNKYSGGKWGSGQPALVYTAQIDLNHSVSNYVMELVGHSSPDGSNGELYSDLSQLTTALEIIKEITIDLMIE